MILLPLAMIIFAQMAAPTVLQAEELPLAIQPGDAKLSWGKCPPIFPSGCEIAILHGNPAQQNSDVFLRLAPGATLPAHWHSSPERMTLSTGRLRVAYKGAQGEVLQPGSYAYGPAKHVHEASCVGVEACVLFIAFEGPIDAHLAE